MKSKLLPNQNFKLKKKKLHRFRQKIRYDEKKWNKKLTEKAFLNITTEKELSFDNHTDLISNGSVKNRTSSC